MSREQPNTSASVSPIASETRPVLLQSRASTFLHSLHKSRPSASTPSDSDFVSPFTFAPLPTFQRTRSQQPVLKSPEQHRRSNSSLFYAAAWGSPLTPSPQESPASGHSTGKSLDLSRPSPSRFGSGWIGTIGATGATVAKYLYSPEKPTSQAPSIRRHRSQSPKKNRSERENWLSDSEGSDIEAQGDESIKTPTRTLFSKLRAGSFGKAIGHRSQESTVTVTLENFNAPTSSPKTMKAVSTTELSNMAALGEIYGSPGKEKPLPFLPRRMSSTSKIDGVASTPTSPNQPRLPSLQTFQRPKKQVFWKGKKCIIALPLQDREEAGLPPPLSPTDVKERLRKWEIQGFDTHGFVLGDSIDGDSLRGSGHSRPLYPDPVEVSQDRQQRKFQISIPDQAEWDAWVDYIKEEKLRALGVTSSNSEAPASTRSPFSASLSRTSSHYPGGAISPINVPSSAASNPIRLGSNPFSPPFLPSTCVSSQSASISSPNQYPQFPGQNHRYKQSVAQPAMQRRLISPFDPMGQGLGSPGSYFHARQATISPAVLGSLPNFSEVLSPISPLIVEASTNGGQHNPVLEQVLRQQQELRAQLLQEQQQQQQQHMMFNHSSQRPSLPATPRGELNVHPKLEIAHPAPQSHRHNLSEALQKEIENSEKMHGDENAKDVTELEEQTKNIADPEDDRREEDEDEIPILKRLDGPLDSEDIITNPSNEPSPAPRDDQDPLANWKPSNPMDRLKPQPDVSRGHKVQPSMSKLNVQAKEFDPKGAFTSSNFLFDRHAFPTTGGATESFGFGGKFMSPKPTAPVTGITTRLNVEAPTFTPSSQSKPPLPSKPPTQADNFRFSAATFNVEAPEFSPSTSLTEKFKTRVRSGSEAEQAPGRIFGDVVIDTSSKTTRRGPKAVSTVRPRSKEGPEDEEGGNSDARSEESAEDESGRPLAPVERQKRARRADSDGDRSPIFAASAPFNHRRILSEIVDDAAMTAEIAKRDGTPPVDGWGYVNAENADGDRAEALAEVQFEENLGEKAEDRREENSSPNNPWSPFAFKSDKDALDFNTAKPPSQRQHRKSEDVSSEIDSSKLSAPFDPDFVQLSTENPDKASQPQDEQTDQKPAILLSALAEPFDFRPITSSQPFQELAQPAPKSQMSGDLLASRFVPSPSPPSSPMSPPRGLSSPPSEMYSYIKPDDDLSAGIDDNVLVEIDDDSELSSPDAFEERAQHKHREALEAVQHANQDARAASDNELSSPEVFAERALRKHREALEAAQRANQDAGAAPDSMSISEPSDRAAEAIPSYEEIDAVMKQFEQNPDLGVERLDTPPVRSPILSTPLIDMRLPPNIRSDAPSPSPRRVQQAESRREDSTEVELRSPRHTQGLGIGVHKLTDGTGVVSDWNDTLSPEQEDKLEHRAQFFDGHVNDLVDGILENRLGPLERTLKTIQHSIALIGTTPRDGHGRRSISNEVKDSDADDEDEYDAFEGFQDYRARSPVTRKDRKPDRVKLAVIEAMAAYKPEVQQSAPVDMSEIHAALIEMRQLAAQATPATRQAELKAIVEDVIGTHPRLRGQRVQQGHDGEEKYRLQIDGLESMLRIANERAEEETKSRHFIEDKLSDTLRRLRHAEEDAAQHQESAEEAERSFSALVKEKEAYRDLEVIVSELSEKNSALESTLDEYRESRTSWQEDMRNIKDDLREEQMKSQDLERTLRSAGEQLHERSKSREALRSMVDRLRGEMMNLVHNVASERSEWREAEHELNIKHKTVQVELEHEHNRRRNAERELEEVRTKYKESLKFEISHAHAHEEITRLQELVASLREESKLYQDNSFKLERGLAHVKESIYSEVAKATAPLQLDLERANSQLFSTRTDADAHIARLQARVDDAELDLEDQKAKHENLLSETADAHNQALQEAADKREAALQEMHDTHERKLADLRDRHTRALHNSSDDRHRLEHNLNEKLALSDDKTQHLESKVQDLEERLAITKSAARAAVEAASAKGINLPTPAPSTVTSPPQRPSLSFVTGSSIPEKISPQALRESIMVLQDQLQNREQAIEKLESEIAAVDQDAPRKIQNLETEIGWLRELLAVRVDDIKDLINILSEPEFDRSSAKDAAIRLKANLQMEQQLKERAASGATGLPASISLASIASLSSTLTQSPRALPMAAAAAWGNWRKARDSSFGALSDLAGNLGSQTPTKASVGSPASFLSGIMTPPVSSFKSPPPTFGESSTPSASRPLAGLGNASRKGSGEARPLRAYNSQPRALSKRKDKEAERSSSGLQHRQPEAPVTPTLKGRESLDENEDERGMGFGEDVDEDASPLEGREGRSFGLA